MPTYEYLCQSCGHQFDIYQSFSDDALTTCSECSGELVKVFGNVGIAFKGSGFYKTDSRSGGAKGSSTAGSTTSKSTDSSSDSSSGSSDSSTTSTSDTSSGSSKETTSAASKSSSTDS